MLMGSDAAKLKVKLGATLYAVHVWHSSAIRLHESLAHACTGLKDMWDMQWLHRARHNA